MASTRWRHAGESPSPVYEWVKQGEVTAVIVHRAVMTVGGRFGDRGISATASAHARGMDFQHRTSWPGRMPPPSLRADAKRAVAANRTGRPAIAGHA